MTVLSSTTRAALLAEKTALETRLAAANTAMDAAIASGKKSYKFDSTEGMQSVTNVSFEEHMKMVEWLERRLDFVDRRLNGKIVFNANVRRKFGSRSGGRFGY